MRTHAFVTGILLILLSLVSYALRSEGVKAITAFIPAFIGLPFLICGALATTPARNKHAMHVAALVALIGASTLGMAVPKLVKAANGIPLERPLAVFAQLGTGVICTVFLFAAVRSFAKMRLLKKADNA